MPSEPMNIQEQGFRSSLFGFDKNDVLAYMNALANEAQQHELEYQRQLQQLQSRLDELRRTAAMTAASRPSRPSWPPPPSAPMPPRPSRRESEEQLETLQKQTASYQSNQREIPEKRQYLAAEAPRSAAAGGRAAEAAYRRTRPEYRRAPAPTSDLVREASWRPVRFWPTRVPTRRVPSAS